MDYVAAQRADGLRALVKQKLARAEHHPKACCAPFLTRPATGANHPTPGRNLDRLGLICHFAFDAKLLNRRARAENVEKRDVFTE